MKFFKHWLSCLAEVLIYLIGFLVLGCIIFYAVFHYPAMIALFAGCIILLTIAYVIAVDTYKE